VANLPRTEVVKLREGGSVRGKGDAMVPRGVKRKTVCGWASRKKIGGVRTTGSQLTEWGDGGEEKSVRWGALGTQPANWGKGLNPGGAFLKFEDESNTVGVLQHGERM